MRVIWRIIGYLRQYRRHLIVAYVSLFIAVSAQLSVPLLVRHVIDDGIAPGARGTIVSGVLLIIGAVAVQAVFTYLRTYLFQSMAERVSTDVRRGLYEHLLTLPFSYFDVSQSGQLMSRATEDVNAIRRFLMFSLRMAVYSAAMVVIISILLLRAHFTLGLIALAMLPPLLVTTSTFSRNIRPMFARVQQQFGEMSSILQENLAGTRVVRVFAREVAEVDRFDASLDDLYQKQMSTIRYYSFFFPLMHFISQVGLCVVLWYGGHQVLDGKLSVGTLVAFNLYLSLLSMPVRQLGWIMNSVARAIASGERIFDVLDIRPAIRSTPDASPLQVTSGEVVFDNVSLIYPHTSKAALRNISLRAGEDDVIGLIGPTGSGKSSILNLIPRFYDVTGGSVSIDGQDVRSVTLPSIRRTIGVVMQESFLFSQTIRENIAFGNEGATQAQVETAARIARAHDFISELPEGYDTILGERGVSLSGGQRQRISIARAICSDPRILLLDDATASVDSETEWEIQQALRAAMQGRTTFLVAQRVSTLKYATEILVLEAGEIVERGTHEALITAGGQYERLYDLQLRQQEELAQAVER